MSRAVQSLDLRIRKARPGASEHTIACGDGLLVRVLPKGTKIFSLRYRPKNSSTQRRVTIGRYPDMTLAKARIEADRMRSEVGNGRDPVVDAKRREQSAEAPKTIDDLISIFLADYVRPTNKPSTAKETERLLNRYLKPTLGKRRLLDVTRADVASLIAREFKRITAEGKISDRANTRGTSANRIKAAASKLFSFAVSRGWLEINPVRGLEAAIPEKSRKRSLSAQEIGQLWNELMKTRERAAPLPITYRIVALLLLTGARTSEIATQRVRHFDKEASTITFEDAKTEESNRTIPLSAGALQLFLPAIEGLKRAKPNSFVFPAEEGSQRSPHVHKESITRAGARLVDELGHTKPAPWTIRDLRRTFITWAHETGHEPELVRRVTGHAARDVHGRVYDRSKRLDAMRALLNEWAAYVAACGAKEAAKAEPNVVQLSMSKRS
ncbi:MAG TPA: integrase arm-type DNA-binding domain-containing protein [Aestuariivirga sp.]|nr:integrase arm-type DNA-binding domain-containing protein [Aestuariivirga sp.]